MNITEKWLSVEAITWPLEISKEIVYRWLEKEKIPALRAGKLWNLRASEVDKWVLKGHAGVAGEDSSK